MATRNIAQHPLKSNFYTCMTSPWWASYLVEVSKSKGIVITQMVDQEYDLPWPGGPIKNSVDTQMKIMKIYDPARHAKLIDEWMQEAMKVAHNYPAPTTDLSTYSAGDYDQALGRATERQDAEGGTAV